MVQAFEEASGKKVNYKLCDRRPGDTVAVWAATDTAERELGWKTKLDVKDLSPSPPCGLGTRLDLFRILLLGSSTLTAPLRWATASQLW